MGMPRWSDDPTHMLGVLANYLRLDDPALAPDRLFARRRAEAEAQVERLAAAAAARAGCAAALVRAALRRTRMFAGLRELPKYHIVEALAAVRAEIAAVGAELAGPGASTRRTTSSSWTWPRRAEGLDGDDAAARSWRSAARPTRQELRRRHVPRVLLSDGTEPEALQASAAGAAGTAADCCAAPRRRPAP